MTFSVSRRALALGITTAVSVSLLAGCSTGSNAPGELGRLQGILQDCPDAPLNTFVQLDESGSARDTALTKERLLLVSSVAERTLVCGGHLKVSVFSSSSGATTALYDGEVTIQTPTENARLKRVPNALNQVMREIVTAFDPAVEALPQDGSDVLAAYRLFAEQAVQLPESRLDAYLLTDGLTNVGPVQITGALTKDEAAALAEQVDVPSLPADSSLTVAGLGRVAGDPVPSDVIAGEVAFYTALCEETGAGECLAITDLAVTS